MHTTADMCMHKHIPKSFVHTNSCTHVHMHAITHTFVYGHRLLHTYTHILMHAHACTLICARVCMHEYVCVSSCLHTCAQWLATHSCTHSRSCIVVHAQSFQWLLHAQSCMLIPARPFHTDSQMHSRAHTLVHAHLSMPVHTYSYTVTHHADLGMHCCAPVHAYLCIHWRLLHRQWWAHFHSHVCSYPRANTVIHAYARSHTLTCGRMKYVYTHWYICADMTQMYQFVWAARENLE